MANLFAVYEECRARTIAGTTLPAERDAASLVLAQPERFLAAVGGSGTGSSAGSRTPYETFIASWPKADVLYAFLASRLKAIVSHKTDGLRPGCRGRYYAWTWGYWGRAAVNAFHALGEERFVRLVADTYDILLGERDDRLGLVDDARKRPVKSWGLASPDGEARTTEVTSTGLILLPVCDLLLGEGSDVLPADQRDRFLASLVETTDEFYDELQYEDTVRGGYFRDALTGEVEALNHSHIYAAALAKLYQMTGNNELLEQVESIARYFLASCTLEENETYSWPYTPVPGNLRHERPPKVKWSIGGEPFYKAAVTIEFPVAAYEAGIAFSPLDMERIADSFAKNVFLPNDDLNVYVTSLKPRPGAELASRLQSQFMFIACAGLLDAIRPQLRADVIRMLGRRPDWFPAGWFGQARAAAMMLTWFMRGSIAQENRSAASSIIEGTTP